MPAFPRSLSAGAKATLRIEAPQNALFVHPPPVTSELPTQELIIRGLVKLFLPKARLVDDLVVKLESRAAFFAPECRIDEALIGHSVSLLASEHARFEAGEHAFAFEFPVPATAAPWDRNPFGRITMNIKAEITGQINLTDVLEIFWFAGPEPNQPPADLDFQYHEFDANLGSYAFEILSPEVTPGALSRTFMAFENPTQDIYIYRLEMTCIQALRIQSLTDPSKKATPAPLRTSFATVDASNAKDSCNGKGAISFNVKSPTHKRHAAIHCEAQKQSSFMLKARLPKDNVLRPSTHPGTRTPLNISHAIEVKILYSIGNLPQLRNFVLSTPVSVSSCTLMTDNIMVPEYSEVDESPSPPKNTQALQQWLEARDHCCILSLDFLLERSQKWPPPHWESRRGNSGSTSSSAVTKSDSLSSRPVSPT